MNLSTHTTTRRGRTGRALALILSIGLLAPSALADDAPASQAPSVAPAASDASHADAPVELSPYELASLIRQRLAAYQIAPKATMQESAVRAAWRVGLKPRAARMVARMKAVADGKRWNVRTADMAGWAPKTESTARILRELAGLYVDLSAAEARVAKARIVEKDVLYFGHVPQKGKRKPTQEIQIVGAQTPSRDFFDRLGRDRRIERLGRREEGEILIVDRDEVEELRGAEIARPGERSERIARPDLRHVRIRIWDREVEQRMKDARQAKFDAQVAAIRADIDAYAISLRKDRELVRALVAGVMLGEELRLGEAVSNLEDTAKRREALGMLDTMKLGRINARQLVFNKASDYGRALRKEWMQKRAKLMKLLAKA